ncbi:MAG: type I pullulanase [Candidatus Rifleibacteriota bacterium]
MLENSAKKLLCIAFGFVLAGCVVWADLEQDVVTNLNRVARDMHYSSQVSQTSDETAAAAFAREASSIESLGKIFFKLETENEIIAAAEQIRLFGYRVRSDAEKRAFEEGLRQLENRVKYLVQTEGANLVPALNKIQAIRKDFESKSKDIEPVFSARVKKIANKSRIVNRSTTKGLLGAHVSNGNTTFSVYSPAAKEVNLILFNKADDKTGRAFPMKKNSDGIWSITIKGELYGMYYGYTADGPNTDGYLFDPERLLSDPYAFANVDHNGKSIVVNREFKWTDQNFKRPAAKDAIIYEMHVKDYTAHESSGVSPLYKGKYVGLLQGKGTDKVLGHLKELGVNCLELLPVHEFDNNFAGVTNHWGYMTSHFFAPECSYATGKAGQAVNELKATINGLHREGFAVIMDVVFNHTAEGDHRGVPLNFKGFDNPGYYRLMDNKKYYWNGTGCGNEFRSDSLMGSKVILDSLKYFVEEYHVDGFRFDLATIIDKHTMQRIIDELPEDIILVGEPWAADWKRNQWGKSDFRNTRLGKWNDDFREKIRAFISGNGNRNDVMTVLAGTCFWWTAKPTESVNYLAAHDGYTICDLFHGDKKKARLAAIALLTAQGIPMIHEGQEFNRSKKGNHNSYDQDNEINWIDWNVKKQNYDIFELYKGLIALRKKYDNFKHPVALNNQHIEWILPANQNGVGMILKGKDNFIVLMNGDQNNWVNFRLPPGTWNVVCDGEKVRESGLYTAEGDYNVPAVTGVILKKK